MVAERLVHLGELQPDPHGEVRQREGAGRTGPHRPGELPVSPPSGRRGAAQAGRGGEGEHAGRRSRASGARRRRPAPRRRARPPPPSARDPSPAAASSASLIDERVGVADRARPAATPRRTAAAPGRRRRRSRCASAAQHQRRVPPRAPGGSCATARSRRPASAPARRGTSRPAASPAPSRTTPCRPPATWSNEAASTIAAQRSASAVCPVNTAIQPASTASGGYSSIAASPSADEPPLHRRHLARLVGRQDQLRHQLDAAVALGRCSAGARAASAGDPLASYQSAARRCSFMTTSGSTRRSSPSRNSRNSAW